jgi:arginase family enzyme
MKLMDEAVPEGFPLILGGDCCTSTLPILAALSKHYPDIYLVFFDAHGDYNTPTTTPTGFLGGMGLAATTGEWTTLQELIGIKYIQDPKKTYLLGYRNLDEPEEKLLTKSGIKRIHAKEIINQDPDTLINQLNLRGKQIYIHIDPDVIDPTQLPSLHYHEPNGVKINKLISLLNNIVNANSLISLSINGLSPHRKNASADIIKLINIIEEVLKRKR